MNYRVFLALDNGHTLQWTHLTETQAKRLYSVMNKHIDWFHPGTTVTSIGWEVMK